MVNLHNTYWAGSAGSAPQIRSTAGEVAARNARSLRSRAGARSNGPRSRRLACLLRRAARKPPLRSAHTSESMLQFSDPACRSSHRSQQVGSLPYGSASPRKPQWRHRCGPNGCEPICGGRAASRVRRGHIHGRSPTAQATTWTTPEEIETIFPLRWLRPPGKSNSVLWCLATPAIIP